MSAHISILFAGIQKVFSELYVVYNPTHLHINFSKNYLKAFIIKQFNFVILLM